MSSNIPTILLSAAYNLSLNSRGPSAEAAPQSWKRFIKFELEKAESWRKQKDHELIFRRVSGDVSPRVSLEYFYS